MIRTRRWKYVQLTLISGLFTVLLFKSQAQTNTSQALDTLRLFTNLDSALKYPDEVVRLKLERKRLKKVPESIMHFKQLRWLSLSNNKLKELPGWFKQLAQLEVLELSKNKFDEFPEVICELTQLKGLVISRNDLYQLPTCIASLSSLEALDIWETNVASVPIEMGEMAALKLVDMRSIQMNENEQQNIVAILPKGVEVNFSEPCDCNFGE